MDGTVTMPLKDFLTLKQELDHTKQQLAAINDVTNRQAVVISADLKFCEVDVYTTYGPGLYEKNRPDVSLKSGASTSRP